MQKPQMALATLTAVIGMALLSTAPVKADMGGMGKEMGNMEKCYGIVKAHRNDCKTGCACLCRQSRQEQRQKRLSDGPRRSVQQNRRRLDEGRLKRHSASSGPGVLPGETGACHNARPTILGPFFLTLGCRNRVCSVCSFVV